MFLPLVPIAPGMILMSCESAETHCNNYSFNARACACAHVCACNICSPLELVLVSEYFHTSLPSMDMLKEKESSHGNHA